MQKKKHIGIVGAGLVGSVLSIYLARRGYQVSIYERRSDLRIGQTDEGRSINLALSTRGIRALDELGLASAVKELAIPIHGRMMHDRSGNLSFLPYGKQGQFINSITRSGLNQMLLDEAEAHGVSILFNHRCTAVDLNRTSATFQINEKSQGASFDLLIGADGAFSVVRAALQFTDRFNYSQFYLEHGYKELTIPATADVGFAMERNALHIWPRESFMMIALPNPDRTFTCTLFLPFEGKTSFAALADDEQKINSFFTEMFPDAVHQMPGLIDDYRSNPASSLVTIKCFPWVRNQTLVIGDAAHGIVPFYGQGMNAGFEDCRILNMLLDESKDDWNYTLRKFQEVRKEDADAIAELAFDNFVEMRDLVADPEFLLRKKIEAKLHELFPDKWIPLYSMVTFNDDIRYSEAFRKGKKQAAIMDAVMKTPAIEHRWKEMDFSEIVNRLD